MAAEIGRHAQAEIEAQGRELLADLDRMIQQCLEDPDMAHRSAEFKEGYARGMRETFLTYVMHRIG